jgi:hypothetical protein
MRLFFLILFPLLMFGQVGINRSNPKASLDIYGFPNDPSMSSGFIAPRLTLSQLNSKLSLYSSETVGAIIYITELNLISSRPEALSKVLDPGYYFYNGEYWEPFETKSGYNVLTASTLTPQTISSNTFTVINLTMTNDPFVRWNASKSSYTIPISGVYLFLSDIELNANENPSRSIYLAVNNINNQALIIDGAWKYNPTSRFTLPYTKMAYFAQGTEVVFYTYSLSKPLRISGAQLSITLLKPIEN